MISIESNEIKKLEKIGSGKFGCVYKINDKFAYKIYHKTIVSVDRIIDNPALTISLNHYKSLIKRSKKLIYSKGIYDLVYINNNFAGVYIPYYDGKTLNEITDKPIDLKINLAKKMIKYSKELNNHLIYPTDYKLNNIIFTNDDIKLIDIDDVRTHVFYVPSYLFRTFSINALSGTIETFLKEQYHLNLAKSVAQNLEREKFFYASTYKKIEDYINRKEILKNFVFTDNLEYLKSLREIILNNNFKIVYLINSANLNKNEYLNIINKLKMHNLGLFDFVTWEKLDNYYNLENINEGFTIINKELKRIYKK